MDLRAAATACNAQREGGNVTFTSVSTDTRTLAPGGLFVAIKGPNFNGHAFVQEAIDKGAVALLVEEDVDSTVPTLRVSSTLTALGQLAAYHRSQLTMPIAAVTGSCGKTTTKAMLAEILKSSGATLATEGTLNNHIGLPLTLLKARPEHRYVVLEMGANHPGEIAELMQIARPTVTAITNAAPVHTEGFGSVEGVAKAKSEIYEHLDEQGTAVLNLDDAYADLWKSVIGSRQTVSFSQTHPATVSTGSVRLYEDQCAEFFLAISGAMSQVKLSLPGRHQVNNALTAAGMALAMNIPLKQIVEGLKRVKGISRRLQRETTSEGTVLIDDSYNANLASTTAALEVLAKAEGRRIFAFGDMFELGDLAIEHHARVGEVAREQGIDELYACGELSRHAVEAFGQGGEFFEDQQALIEALRERVDSSTTVLAKGSNAMAMWKVIEALK